MNNILNKDRHHFILVAGPCIIESKDMAFEICKKIVNLTKKLKIKFIFKGSYRKANRTRIDSFTGIGDLKALEIIKDIGGKFNVSTLTDIHNPEEADIAAKYVDILQIPAFLCRQTDLLRSAAKTGKLINIKKGQFLSPESMEHAINKIKENNNNNIMLTERGTMFGYQNLVVDYRAIPIMQNFGFPVILDVTHSLQKPNQENGITGGNPEMIETIAKAGIAAGAEGIFLETHPNPKETKSDGENMLQLNELESLLQKLVSIKKAL